MSDVVERLGGLAHLVADANNPVPRRQRRPAARRVAQRLRAVLRAPPGEVPDRLLRPRSAVPPRRRISTGRSRARRSSIRWCATEYFRDGERQDVGGLRRPVDRLRRRLGQLLARRHRPREPLLLHLEGSRRRRPLGSRHARRQPAVECKLNGPSSPSPTRPASSISPAR